MAKYKRQEEPEDTLTYAEEMNQQQSGPEPTDAEEASFKKRYGDLRRHSQQLMQQKDQQLAEVKNQLDSAAKGQIKFPKTDEEIDAWSRKYPDVAKIVDTIAQKRAGEALAEGEKRMEGLRQLETKLTRQEAEQQLVKTHPDFHDIRQDPGFHEWVAEQPSGIQDALYKNNTDAEQHPVPSICTKLIPGSVNLPTRSQQHRRWEEPHALQPPQGATPASPKVRLNQCLLEILKRTKTPSWKQCVQATSTMI